MSPFSRGRILDIERGDKTIQKRILIVDDEAPIREICVRILAPLGHSVETAENAMQALDCFEKHPFDLLITDYRMPGALDGLELGREIRQGFPNTQIILMTGYPSVENAISALQVGASDYLVKPFDQTELIDYVGRRHSTPGEITLPTGSAELIAPSPAAAPGQRVPVILLVDDSRTILALFRGLFERSGYLVLTAKDGEMAMAALTNNKPNLVLMDGELPDQDGFDLCRKIRLDPKIKSVKIVMFTGGSEVRERQRACAAGADRFLSKSATPAAILQAVHEILNNEGQGAYATT